MPITAEDRARETINKLLSTAGWIGQFPQRNQSLKHAFQGTLVPQDPNHEPASALLARIRGTAISGCAPPTSTKPRRKLAHHKPPLLALSK